MEILEFKNVQKSDINNSNKVFPKATVQKVLVMN